MKRFSVIGLLITLLVVVGLLPSCRSKTALRDRIVVTALGLNGTTGAYTVSVQSVESLKTASGLSEQSEAATAVYEAKGASFAAALDAFLEEAGRQTYILQNRLIVVNETLCRSASLFDTLHYLIRHTEGGSRVPIAVCRGEPSAVLNCQSGNDAISANYPVGILKDGIESGVCVPGTLLDVRRAASGMTDMAVPILRMVKERPHPDGTLLFREGVAVGELSAEQTTGLCLLLGRAKSVLLVLDGVTYAVQSPRTSIAITRDGTRHAYTFSVTAQAEVVEKRNGSTVREALITDGVRQIVEQALTALDAVDCDVLGLARLTAQHDRSVTQKTARSHLKECDKAVSVTIRLGEGNGTVQ